MKVANWLENILIAVVIAVLTVFVVNELKFKPMQKLFEKQIKEQNILIDELSKRETYKIENSFDKIKTKDGKVNLQINSEINKNDIDTLENEQNRSMWNRLFDKK